MIGRFSAVSTFHWMKEKSAELYNASLIILYFS